MIVEYSNDGGRTWVDLEVPAGSIPSARLKRADLFDDGHGNTYRRKRHG